ncbi:zinc-binding dehydrogenase [Pseudomonas sp. NA-150]|uniref:zinc-binding dehydrogenase n=1 Tax=Pseudomonas sp. NA-150 TaxID=3367525 RepID=UPI0037CABFFE
MRLSQQVIVNRFGGPDVLTLVDVPVPVPIAGQLLLKVETAGVLYGDVMRRTDRYLIPTILPYEPGTEVAGTVIEAGQSVGDFEVGDRVLCRVASKGYAHYAVVDATRAIHLPDDIEFGAATALLAQGITAYLLTHQLVPLKGKTVFIEGAAGGVGTLMVQLARLFGASLIVGSASSETKRTFARNNGVDCAIDTSSDNWSQQILDVTKGKGIDVGYDSSGATVNGLLDCLSEFGTLVKFGRGVNENQVIEPSRLVEKNLKLVGFYLPAYFSVAHAPVLSAATDTLIKLAVSGQLKIRVEGRYPLSEAAAAHRELEGRRSMGKLVIEPWR